MQSILDTVKSYIRSVVKEDSIVVDFTMGNGSDTQFLAELVPNGHVYAFDIQPQAIINTREKLKNANLLNNVTLINTCHSNAKEHISQKISAGMFNLGYLPGFDKTITTKLETTLFAINSAMEMLTKEGILIIVVYPGHDEGRLEGIEIEKMLSATNKKYYDTMIFRIINVPDCPFMFMVQTRS